MDENPYESPNVDSSDLPAPKHRSFRLTRDPSTEGAFTVGTFRDAVKFSLVQQLPLLLISSAAPGRRDGLPAGLDCHRCVLDSHADRRDSTAARLPDSDILLVKWGYVPIVLVTFVAWAIACQIRYAIG